MEYFPPALEKMVEQFARLPGIGHKTAQRLAFFVLSLPENEVEQFAQAILEASGPLPSAPSVRTSRKERGCAPSAPVRNEMAAWSVWWPIPRMSLPWSGPGNITGPTMCSHGVLSPMNGVGPDDLYIKSLLDRVAQGEIQEVIMATNPDTEGEATAMYLSRMLKPFGVKVTRLAYGVPVGGHLEYADDATLMRALEGRAGDVKREERH